jgi:hypothetical protein
MPYTRGYMLADALCFALGKLQIRGFKRLLTEEDRDKIAADVVRQLKERGWREMLEEVLPDPGPGYGPAGGGSYDK